MRNTEVYNKCNILLCIWMKNKKIKKENKTMTNTTKTTEVTMKEIAQAFEGKYVRISPEDRYGISIEMTRGTIEYEDDLKPELWLVARDYENNVAGSICIDEDTIESIEKFNDGTYTINFTLNMTSVDVAESNL